MKKRIISIILGICLFILMSAGASAEDKSQSYDFDLAVNGSHVIQAGPGDVLTVTLILHCSATDTAVNMYGMQDEIRYDNEFLEILKDGILLASGVQTADIGLQGGNRAFYLNFLSQSGAAEWGSDTLVGTFQVKVKGESGSTTMFNENCLVSLPDGSDSYAVTVQNLTVIVSSDCTVRFEPENGEKAYEVTAEYGELLAEPETPQRPGYAFIGWYKDVNLTKPWNFETETINGNMTLYAGWEEQTVAAAEEQGGDGSGLLIICIASGFVLAAIIVYLCLFRRRTVCYYVGEKEKYKECSAICGFRLKKPNNPTKDGRTFGGWYTDNTFAQRWNFERDTVKGNMNLYARWLD